MATFTQTSNANAQPSALSLAEMPATQNSSAGNQYSMIGKSIVIKGEILASDPVYVYGKVEGSITAPEHRVTVGKEGTVKANIRAREVVVMGDVCGNLDCRERVEIRADGSLMGDLSTSRIFIEEGAVLSGSIDVHKPNKKEKAEAREEQAVELEDEEIERKGVVSFEGAEVVEEIAS